MKKIPSIPGVNLNKQQLIEMGASFAQGQAEKIASNPKVQKAVAAVTAQGEKVEKAISFVTAHKGTIEQVVEKAKDTYEKTIKGGKDIAEATDKHESKVTSGPFFEPATRLQGGLNAGEEIIKGAQDILEQAEAEGIIEG
jgi:hypothetical protein